ncbi:MAG: DUF362 domain-containing protein [Planctomycetota bacterium]|jgi:uncharacterized protein (DUF362 family)
MSNELSRRAMLGKVAKTGLAVAAVGGGAWWLHGRTPRGAAAAPRPVPSFAVDRDGPRMVIARGTDAGALVDAALEEFGGIAQFVGKGDVVLVKPNAAFDRPEWMGTTTNPAVLRAVVKACVRAGAAEVIVTDNPIHAPEGCFRKTGLGRATEEAGGKVLLPRAAAFAPVALEGSILDGWPVYLEPLLRADKVIGIAPVKDHNLALASLTLKNWFGMLGGPRNRLHQKMDETISDLAALVKPTLSILDGSRILMRNGPTGGSPDDVVDGDVLAFCTDGVALDAFGATLLDRAPGDLEYLRLAESHARGTRDWMSLHPREITG